MIFTHHNKEDCHAVGGPGGMLRESPLFLACWEGERQEFSKALGSSRPARDRTDNSWGWERRGGWTCLQPWLSGPSSHPSSGRQVKPVVSQFLHEKQLPYNEDTYLARFWLFLSRYEEFMVQTPPITELVGLQ